MAFSHADVVRDYHACMPGEIMPAEMRCNGIETFAHEYMYEWEPADDKLCVATGGPDGGDSPLRGKAISENQLAGAG